MALEGVSPGRRHGGGSYSPIVDASTQEQAATSKWRSRRRHRLTVEGLDCRQARLHGATPQSLRGSSNGRTPVSGSGYQGSNPCPRAGLFLFRPLAVSSLLSRSSPLPTLQARTAKAPVHVRRGPHRLVVRTSASHAENSSSNLLGVTSRVRSHAGRHCAMRNHATCPVSGSLRVSAETGCRRGRPRERPAFSLSCGLSCWVSCRVGRSVGLRGRR